MKNFFGRISTVILGNLFTILILSILFITGIMVLSVFGSLGSEDKKLAKNSILEIKLNDPILESKMEYETNIFDLGNEPQHFFLDQLRAIETAKEDDKIDGISLKLSSFKGGISQLQDLRKALTDFKESGKFIYAYGEDMSQGAYYLATTADSIFQHPLGSTELKGLNAEVMYFKNLGDKYGIDFQVIRHGDFKAAVEPFLRDNMSEENRAQTTQLLNDIWQSIAKEVADSRHISLEELNVATDSLSAFIVEDALKQKLIDVISFEPDYDEFLSKKINLEVDEDKDFHKEFGKRLYSLNDYMNKQKMSTKKDKVAVLYASGTITKGDGSSGIQSETYINAIRKIKENEKVKAVVFRINSGGGDAFASDEILEEIKDLREQKPVIVSFGDVAASGGYYIAVESDSIFAQPTTITGSIGVFGMIPNIEKLANNVGITTDQVKTHTNSDIFTTITTPLSESSKHRIGTMVEHVYDRFVNLVSEGRGMTYAEVDSIGSGRVWSGVQAKKIGLIDTFGNLNDAINAAAKKADLELGEFSIRSYPHKKEGIEEILSQFQVNSSTELIKQELGSEYYSIYKELKGLKENSRIQLKMPYSINIQ